MPEKEKMFYALVRNFKTHDGGVIKKGVIRNEIGWRPLFPDGEPGFCDRRIDWFVPRPPELKIEHLAPGDTVLADIGIGENVACLVNRVVNESRIELLYGGSSRDPHNVPMSQIVELLAKGNRGLKLSSPSF
jgi:hypothetical protein